MEQMNMEDKLKEKIELSILFDFYGELLKKHNKQIFEDYILNDLSLGEIAEEQGISRQGVYDIVKRCSKQLRECEDKLNLVNKFQKTKMKANRIKEISKQIKDNRQSEIKALTDNSSLLEEPDAISELTEIISLADSIIQDL